MTKYSGQSLLRHEAAIKSAERVTANLQQTIDDLQGLLSIAKVEFGKAYHAAYYTAFDALAEKAFNTAYSERVAHAKADFDKAFEALKDKE